MENKEKLLAYWKLLYPDVSNRLLTDFLKSVEFLHSAEISDKTDVTWYKDAVVYSLYVDLFNEDLPGLTNKLEYLEDLGVTCLWLLPVLDSPMRDAGFDIRDYLDIRPELVPEAFPAFLEEAHRRNIRVIFDIAINHTSDQHPWFREAVKSTSNPYRQYYIWSKDTTLYQKARIIFKGIETSNWEACGEEYYFHRFFSFQPDLNYHNPEVLFSMCRNLLYWQHMGVDGFRADAIPYLWKEENTDCENLTNTHVAVKFFRALLDHVKPGTLLLAEACQKPAEVVSYLGEGDECHAAYHFPLMPRIFKSIAMQSGKPIEETLSENFTPTIPENCQWFTFLRCHDELSLELVYVSEEERKYIHDQYCHQPLWNFRMGEGISARLSELMERDPRKILLACSIILTLPGTPVIYYGDEFGKTNDEAYYHEMITMTGKDDTRFLVRGRINWSQVGEALSNPSSLENQVYGKLRKMLRTRSLYKVFGRGKISFREMKGTSGGSLLAFRREYGDQKLIIIHNMTSQPISLDLRPEILSGREILDHDNVKTIEAYGFRWIEI
ncbi:MAG: alpha-amylase family glycosyl hydrolase [Bacteroidetes bacterium]|nr:alpha-amylase family glycosyl hydrolase [Bacteroidota bacterium]